jgi:hypothetical protein
MDMTLTLGSFMETAQQAADGHSLRLSGDNVKANGRFRHAVAWASTHRLAMREFLNALKVEFGTQVANTAAAGLGQGQPLTARKVKDVVALAQRINEALGDFVGGVDHNGQPVARSLDAAIGQWLAKHPASPPLSQLQIAQVKSRITESLLHAGPPCKDVEEMFQAVSEGRLPFVQDALRETGLQKGRLAHLGIHLRPDHPIQWTQAEYENLLDAAQEKALAGYGGGLLPVGNVHEAMRDAANELATRFDNYCQAIQDSGLPQNVQDIVRGLLFQKPGGVLSLMPQAAFDDLLLRRQVLVGNTQVGQAVSDSSSGSDLRRQFFAALEEEGLDFGMPEEDFPEPIWQALSDAVEKAVGKAGNAGAHTVSMEEGQALQRQAIDAWIHGVKQAQNSHGALADALFDIIMKSPELLTAGYIAQLQAGTEEGRVSQGMLQRAMGGHGEIADRILALDEILAAVRAQMQALPADVPAPAGFQRHCLTMAIMRQGLPESALAGLQEALLSEETQALKAFLHLESGKSPDAFALLSMLMQLQGAADGLGAPDSPNSISPERQQARQEDFPHAGTVDELPPEVQALAGHSPNFAGTLPIPELRTGVDAILAHRRASDDVMHDLAHYVPHQLVNYLVPAARPTFEKDFPRGMNLVLEGARVDNSRAEGTTEGELVQRGYDALAGFLFPGQAFASLDDGQKRQVALLAGLCNQEMEKPVLQKALVAFSPILSEQRMDGIILSIEVGSQRRSIELGWRDGDIVIRCSQSFHYNIADFGGGRQAFLDPASSQVSVLLEASVSLDEIERVANLDWSGIGELTPIPESHRLQFSSCTLTSSLQMDTAQA